MYYDEQVLRYTQHSRDWVERKDRSVLSITIRVASSGVAYRTLWFGQELFSMQFGRDRKVSWHEFQRNVLARINLFFDTLDQSDAVMMRMCRKHRASIWRRALIHANHDQNCTHQNRAKNTHRKTRGWYIGWMQSNRIQRERQTGCPHWVTFRRRKRLDTSMLSLCHLVIHETVKGGVAAPIKLHSR